MTDYSELKRLAEAAPEGPWFGPEYAPGTSYVFDVDLGTLLAYEGIDSEKDACLRYVAAASPVAVLALIAENERLAGECEGCPMSTAEDLRIERDQLKAENEALKCAQQHYDCAIEGLMHEAKALRKQIYDMSPLKGAPLTGPDLKCLACGGYHYGMGGLPCPKMAPMAQGAGDD